MNDEKRQRIPPDVIEKARAIDLYTYLKVYEPNELVDGAEEVENEDKDLNAPTRDDDRDDR